MHSINWFIFRLASPLRRLRSDSEGVVAVVVALAIPVLLGFAALAVDTSVWSSTKNSAQGAADAAVLSAVVAAAAGSTQTQIQNEAYASTASAGFTNGQNGVTVTLNNPPTSGSYTGNASAYEVIVRQPQTRFFAGLLGAAPTVTGRAVALSQSPPCILALDPSASAAIGVIGAWSINAKNCDVDANSTDSSAVTLLGVGNLTASHLNVVGNYTAFGLVSVSAIVKTGAPRTPDPYGCPPTDPKGTCLAVPPVSPCLTPTSPFTPPGWTLIGANTATINPGVYCGGISVSGLANLTMNPGIYILDHGDFQLIGAATVTGSGVSIVLTSTTGAWGTVNIAGASSLTLAAPSSGPMKGIAMYVDRAAPANTVAVTGASNQRITGALYFPTQTVQYAGASSIGGCEQLIARKITIIGAANFGHDCGPLDVPGFRAKGVPVE